MKTQNSEGLLEKLRSRLPDADERLMSARESSLRELDAYDRLQRAIDHLSAAEREHLAKGVVALEGALAETDAELSVTLTFADGRHVTVLAEDLLHAANRQYRQTVMAG